MLNNIWLVILFPILGAIINGIFGKNRSAKMVNIISIGAVSLSFFGAVIAFFQLIALAPENRHVIVDLFDWFVVGKMNITIGFLVDPLSMLMLLIITGVGTLIHIYSSGYMKGDPAYHRFFAYLNMFISFMLILVLGSSYLMMFVGWEGVGLSSYLLIGFWFSDMNNAIAGKKAFVVNRIGDFGFILGMFILFWTFGSLNYDTIFELAATYPIATPAITALTLLLFVGATGKSAQIPLYIWLPDAMAGPTPVSALIHAATMVTAGLYMIARSNILFTLAPFTLEIVAFVGVITALVSGLIALTQRDIKKVLAYSTVSQLGYMFLAMGVGAYTAGMFHVMTHAFFKALLFLAAGSVIHAMHHAYHETHDHSKDPQDMRNMGGLDKKMPITNFTFLMGTLAISGVPLFSGFFSKDEILWKAFEHNFLLWFIGAIAAAITAFYMFRLYFNTFKGEFKGSKEEEKHLHESPKSITFPLQVLAVLSVFGGYIGLPHIFHLPNYLEHFLAPVMEGSKKVLGVHASAGHGGNVAMEWIMMFVSIAIAFSAIYLAYTLYMKKKEIPAKLEANYPVLHKLSLNKFYVDEFYFATIINPLVAISKTILHKIVDVKVIDGIVNGIAKLAVSGSTQARKIQTGLVSNYIFFFVIGAIGIIYFVMK